MNDKALKVELLQLCQDGLNKRLDSLTTIISNLQQSLQSETKSTAGDKHETGRAMVQLEREKAGQQLSEIQKTQLILSKINIENSSERIVLGSVVFTTKANYFFTISTGELKAGGHTFYAISPNTPIGKLLLAKTVGETISFRDNSFQITKII